MGETRVQDPHVKRSSSMTFALRWKHENVRLIMIIFTFVLASTFLFFILWQNTSVKQITLIVNGEKSVVTTSQNEVRQLLNEQGVEVDPHDHLSMPATADIKHGDTIEIEHTVPVRLIADGRTSTVYTIEGKVADVLKEQHVPLGELDKVTPALDAGVSAYSSIQIVRVNKTIEERQEAIPYQVVEKNDPNLLKGKQQVVQDGKEGTLVKKIEKIYEDGMLVAQTVIDETVKSEQANKIIAIGTKNPVVVLSASSAAIENVTKDGVTFGAKQVLTNVELTAYSAGFSSTGKRAGDPGYGVTASGTKVTEGRTIAVDPKVIPLGWWVYIDGVGFRRAEDTGSAVKGKRIDVYYESEKYASRFGLKKGYKVYIIGPKKPVAN